MLRAMRRGRNRAIPDHAPTAGILEGVHADVGDSGLKAASLVAAWVPLLLIR
jgi:hypothetical protein